MSLSKRISQVTIPAGVVGIIVMLVIPMPPVMIDLLLTINISVSMLILLISMSVARPLDFALFPTLLLVMTLFRLALNMSTTRGILLDGYAGEVVEGFGNFVIGGNLVVGMIIFLILVIVQFMVITNGAGRVAEVGARFTLDAMPGKQMAIDADLNAGLIDEATARKRREEVAAEADFHGAMDGASKFVKGDALAGLIITAINLIGGLGIGIGMQGLEPLEAVQTYSLLTIGDGLCSQIPALLISIASGIIVTRSTTDGDMGTDVLVQFSRQAGPLKIGGAAIILMGLVPGLPTVPFFLVGAGMVFAATQLPDPNEAKRIAEEAKAEAEAAEAAAQHQIDTNSPEAILSEVQVEELQLEIAYDLMDLVDASRGGDLLDRIKALRRKIATDIGLVIPPVRTRDNMELAPSEYVIRVHGVELGRGTAPAGHVLVIGDETSPELNAGSATTSDLAVLPGQATTEPVFGLPARWVPVEYRQQAEVLGATVVDRYSVITTHLAEIVRTNAGRLLSRTGTKLLADLVKEMAPTVASELDASQLNLGDVQRVLAELLDEGVPITDLVRIFETLSEVGQTTRDIEPLVESVRTALGPTISSGYADNGVLPVIVLDPMTEQVLSESIRSGPNGSFLILDPQASERLALDVVQVYQEAEARGVIPVLVCAPNARQAMRRLMVQANPGIPVLSYSELGAHLTVETVGVVTIGNRAAV